MYIVYFYTAYLIRNRVVTCAEIVARASKAQMVLAQEAILLSLLVHSQGCVWIHQVQINQSLFSLLTRSQPVF